MSLCPYKINTFSITYVMLLINYRCFNTQLKRLTIFRTLNNTITDEKLHTILNLVKGRRMSGSTYFISDSYSQLAMKSYNNPVASAISFCRKLSHVTPHVLYMYIIDVLFFHSICVLLTYYFEQ